MEKLLKRSLKLSNLNFEVSANRTITIKKNLSEALINDVIEVQKIQVKGTVTDSDGQPLAGANILEKGASNGTQSDFDGNFSIAVDQNAVLVVSYLGFTTKEVAVNNQTTLAISLAEDASQLEEIVVVGYGTQKRANLTGAVSSVQGDVLNDRPIVNTGAGLQGVIPNLNITISDGQAGQGANFNIRGFTNLSGQGSPLILVDGVRMSINNVNPNDIESVSVLKDAASAAIYGSQAAFGVVLVTTKKGKRKEGMKVNISSNWSFNRPTEFPDIVNSVQKLDFERAKAANLNTTINEDRAALITAYFNDPENNPVAEINPANGRWVYYGNTSYFDEALLDFSLQKTNNLSISGGGERFNYFLSLGHLDQEGILRWGNDTFERYNIRANINASVLSNLDVRLNTALNVSEIDRLHRYPGKGSPWHDLIKGNVNQPVWNPDGTVPNNPLSFFSARWS